MPNLYGVAQPVPYPTWSTLIGAANVTCPAGVETNVFNVGPIAALDRGVYYGWANIALCLGIGATAPSAIIFAVRVNNGADQGTWQPTPTLLVANTSPDFNWYTLTSVSPTLWASPGSTIQISINPTGQQVIAIATYSQGWFGITRGPDQ